MKVPILIFLFNKNFGKILVENFRCNFAVMFDLDKEIRECIVQVREDQDDQ